MGDKREELIGQHMEGRLISFRIVAKGETIPQKRARVLNVLTGDPVWDMITTRLRDISEHPCEMQVFPDDLELSKASKLKRSHSSLLTAIKGYIRENHLRIRVSPRKLNNRTAVLCIGDEELSGKPRKVAPRKTA